MIAPSLHWVCFVLLIIFILSNFSCASRKPKEPPKPPEDVERNAESLFNEAGQFPGEDELTKKDSAEKPEFIEQPTTEIPPSLSEEIPATADYQPSQTIYPRELANGWVETMGEAEMVNITAEKAWQIADERANSAAVLLICGERISSGMFVYEDSRGNMDISDFSQSVSAGNIVEEKDIQQETYNLPMGAGKPPITVCRVIKKVKVKKDKGAPDPSFHIQADLNKPVFVHGETMNITITPTQD